MSDRSVQTTVDDAERVRLKRLAKLAASTPTASPNAGASPPPTTSTPHPAQQQVSSSLPKPATPPPVASTSTAKRVPVGPVRLDLPSWENKTIGHVLCVTLDRDYAEKSDWEVVWLKHLQSEIEDERPSTSLKDQSALPVLTVDMIDRALIARLNVNPDSMSDDLSYQPVLASLPKDETVFEYLVGCWRRHNYTRSSLLKRNYVPQDIEHGLAVLDRLKDLIISYAGLDLQDPEMFTQTQSKQIGYPELLSALLSMASLSGPLSDGASSAILSSTEVPLFLSDMAQRFEPDDELVSVLGPTIKGLLYHESLARPEGVGGAIGTWRAVLGGLEALVAIKPIAATITKLPEWNPPDATAQTLEFSSLMGPLLRLNVFGREWPNIATTYFSDPETRTREDIESSNASLRGTLKSLQFSLFQIFNAIVRSSAKSREAVLQFFSRAVSLNKKRGGMQVDPATVASDSFMINLQAILLRFSEPFMDSKYSKMDRIDVLYLGHSSRVDVQEETRIKATSDEAAEWTREVTSSIASTPNFISDIFYLTSTVNHLGLNRVLQDFDDMHKQTDELERHVETLNSSLSSLPPGNPFIIRTQAAIDLAKKELSKIHMLQYVYQVQLLDPEFIFRQLGFTNFVEAWLIRLVDPMKTHPTPLVTVPLPQEIPIAFKMLPEYFLEDIVDFLLFLMRHTPMSFDITGRNELVIWALTFLRSTWYIKNPFLKAKINEVVFYGTLGYGREQNGVLGGVLNTNPFALKHLIPALMTFYIEVEQTGASSQFYDKFNARRNIAYILKAVWNNPTHRDALNAEAKDVDKFVRFVNLMINDVTYLMDESLSVLTQIATIQHEMDSPNWIEQPLQHHREREGTLHSLERHALSYTTLGRSTVDLLKIFTAETKAPFMAPEIVERLAAMLDYNLDALVGPRCSDLKVKDREKFRFEPRQLLSDILQIYLNLADREEFVRAVASDGRSYRKKLFEQAAGTARRRSLKTEDEIEQLKVFVMNVEEMKATLESAEEDLGDVPEEFLDPLMFTLMRDPVTLPSSRVVIDRSTIKSHLLSDTKDPFNRMPLSIEDIIPNPELKEKIDAFLAERRSRKMIFNMPDDNEVAMDTSI